MTVVLDATLPYVCHRCEVAWFGDSANCWLCGACSAYGFLHVDAGTGPADPDKTLTL